MIHPDTMLRPVNKEKGLGIFATAFIPKGTITYVQDDLEIEIRPDDPRLKNPLLNEIIEKYSFIDEQGTRIVSWDNAKYVNHCCQCNTISTGYGFELAICDIAAGDEITDEYGLFNFEYELELKCQKSNCRGKVCGSDIETYYSHWDQQIESALEKFEEVSQPLLYLLNGSTLKNLRGYLSGKDKYKSVLNLRLNNEPHYK